MGTLAFRFQDDHLNDQLTTLLREKHIRFTTDTKGNIVYNSDLEDIVENNVINLIRSTIFSSWKLLSAPVDWLERYRKYMEIHKIPYAIEFSDGELNFLIPGEYNPHRWRSI